jgi:hypothetical protein
MLKRKFLTYLVIKKTWSGSGSGFSNSLDPDPDSVNQFRNSDFETLVTVMQTNKETRADNFVPYIVRRKPVLRIRDVSRVQDLNCFPRPGSRVKKIPDPHQRLFKKYF